MLSAKFFFLMIFVKGVVLTPHSDSGRFHDDDADDCDPTNCAAPNCTCFGKWTPGRLSLRNVPQFVMLTFDGPVTQYTVEIFRKIMCQEMEGGPHPPDMCYPRYMTMCPPSATFFVSHEYSDYTLIHSLYNQGNEIAVQSISRESDTDMWKNADATRWKDEIVGMKKILANFSQIPESNIIGFRAPFLQTAGDTTFKVLAENGFVYDSSMPTMRHTDPPLWPYTLDFGYPQDCRNKPCPEKKYPGQWVFPMVQWKRTGVSGDSSYCSMIDSCTPQPTTKAETYHFMMENFNRHFHTNKAPFPIFLHESWLRESGGRNSSRLEGFIQFFEEILRHQEVFVVPMKGVLHYMRHPMPIQETGPVICGGMQMDPAPPCEEHEFCWYPGPDKYMKSCVPCPKNYPWVGNPEGN